MLDEWDRERTEILATNTAQGVYRLLRTLESNRARFLPRWIWELLQNARDVARSEGSLTATIKSADGRVTFCHDGRTFQRQEIAHLIYYGSTKLERDESLGQFGSGFLTTHLLSLTTEVSSNLEDGQAFTFRLDRSGETVADLRRNMDMSWEAFKSSLGPYSGPADRPSLTTFRYETDERATESVNEGINALAHNGPYVTAFNREFRCIRVLSPEGETVLKLVARKIITEHITEVQVAVSEPRKTAPKICRFLVSTLDGGEVAVPFVRGTENASLKPITDVPRLFLGFPLIGTEEFSFPAVIQSSRFTPTEERDGVFLGQSKNRANRENESVLKEACRRVCSTLAFVAKSGWENAWVITHIPHIRSYTWLNEDWLQNLLKEQLVDPIRSTQALVTPTNRVITPSDATIPIADTPESVDRLWKLAKDITELGDRLPRRSEAPGWCNAVHSWAQVCLCSPDTFEEAIDGRKLAMRVQGFKALDVLQCLLSDDTCAADWLNRLHRLLVGNGFGELLRTLSIIPDQTGRFKGLSELRRDRGIPEQLN